MRHWAHWLGTRPPSSSVQWRQELRHARWGTSSCAFYKVLQLITKVRYKVKTSAPFGCCVLAVNNIYLIKRHHRHLCALGINVHSNNITSLLPKSESLHTHLLTQPRFYAMCETFVVFGCSFCCLMLRQHYDINTRYDCVYIILVPVEYYD